MTWKMFVESATYVKVAKSCQIISKNVMDFLLLNTLSNTFMMEFDLFVKNVEMKQDIHLSNS